MSAYIPLIKKTCWIDLSAEHKKLRRELENDVKQACVDKEQLQPIMLQGAFGIGKTNSLYYLFHYGWCELNTPTFYVSLDILIQSIKESAAKQPSGKIQNSDLGSIINNILLSQIVSLKNDDWNKLSDVYFPEFKGCNLNKYLKDFQKVEVIEDSKSDTVKFQNLFSEKVIKQAIDSAYRPILLIDEFESKFYELKKYIETSGGGVLRELFDQVVQDSEMFYLIIGNGPASGYEIAKERGDDALDSETAANRRLKTKQIPFPTANLLQKSFLNDYSKGYINFIWWLSRCRPGHILKLKDALGSSEELFKLNTSELVTRPIFKEPIDDGGESVTYLKTGFFNEIPGKIQAVMLNRLLTSFEPQEFEIEDCKSDLKDCVTYFYSANKTINAESDLLSVLRDDLYIIHLKKFQDEGNYSSVNYIEHIQPYFSYILNGISDNKGNIAFGMIGDTEPCKVLSEIFLIPLLELTYDFISLYQDDSVKETRETLNFLLSIIHQINESKEKDDLDTFVPNTYELFEKCRMNKPVKLFLQLSLHSIRQSIEQPIGSPQLKYKDQQLGTLLKEINSKARIPIIYHKEDNLQLYFIPDLENDLLDNYLSILKEYFYGIFHDRFHNNGEIIIRVIYMSENERVEKFKTSLHFINGDISEPEPIVILKKFEIVNFESYRLNFGGQIRDYLDSISKIGIIGINNGELDRDDGKKEEEALDLKRIIDVIGRRPWTDKKETIRTIEHYKKLLFEGDNSIFKSILKKAQLEYNDKLSELVCDKDTFKSYLSDYSYLTKILNDKAEAYDSFTSQIGLLYLFENKFADETLKQLLKLVKEDYKFEVNKDDPSRGINFKTLFSILTKNQNELETLKKEFDLNSSFISSYSSFAKLLNNQDEITSLSDFFLYLKCSQDSHFIESYHKALGGYDTPELSVTLYNNSYLHTLDSDKIEQELSDSISKIESNFSEVRSTIVEKLEDLKNLINESQTISSYAEKLSKAMKGISFIKQLVNKNLTLSLLLILTSIIEHLKTVLENSKTFSSQIVNIIDGINVQKTKVDVIQDEIDKYYKDSLTTKLLDYEFSKKLIDEYLWKKIFLQDNLFREEIENLLGVSTNYYNPFTSPIIYKDKINKFKELLQTVYNKTQPKFDELMNKIKEIDNRVQDTKKVESFIANLLNSTE